MFKKNHCNIYNLYKGKMPFYFQSIAGLAANAFAAKDEPQPHAVSEFGLFMTTKALFISSC